MRKGSKLTAEHRKKISRTMKEKVNSGTFHPPSEDPEVMKKLVNRMRTNNPSKRLDVRKINREKHMAQNNPNWRGGIRKGDPARSFSSARKFRQKILDRDNWRCQRCGLKSEKGSRIILHAHHILSWKNYPSKRFDMDNSITLCKECHQNIHSCLSSEGLITPRASGHLGNSKAIAIRARGLYNHDKTKPRVHSN